MTKQFFSNNNDINYNDYLKYKKGKEGIKKLISNKNYCVNSFINYETFLTLSKAFYKQINNKYTISPPRSISDADTSYKCYKSVESHVNDCIYCCSCKNVPKIFNCKEIQNILYPYGESVIKQDDLGCMYYPHKLKLDKYCCKKCEKTERGCCGSPNINTYNKCNCNNGDSHNSYGCCSMCKSPCPSIKKNFNSINNSCCYQQNYNTCCIKNNNAVNTFQKYNFNGCECKKCNKLS